MKESGLLTKDRLCGCSFIHPHQTLSQGLELALSLGFNRVDIGVGGANGHYHPSMVAQAPLTYSEEVLRSLPPGMQLNECFALNFGTPINTPDLEQRRQNRELFEGLCRFAREAAFKSVLIILGPIYQSLGRQGSLDLAIKACAELLQIANEYDVQLNVETDCESCANTPEAAFELCCRVPGLGLTLDYSHFICQGIRSEDVEQLYPFTRHLHVRQAALGQIVTDVDTGSIDYARVVQNLEASGYRGLYCIEYLSLQSRNDIYAQSEAQTRAMSQEIRSYLQNT